MTRQITIYAKQNNGVAITVGRYPRGMYRVVISPNGDLIITDSNGNVEHGYAAGHWSTFKTE